MLTSFKNHLQEKRCTFCFQTSL